jgi:DNA-binding NarL/FixJ family response regulator
MKLLVADDSTMLRERIIGLISELNQIAVINQTDDLTATLHSIRSVVPDVAILDRRIISGRGISALQNMKRENPAMTIVVLTDLPSPLIQNKYLGAGADFYLDKSTEIGKLREIIHGLHQQSKQ